MITRLAVSEPIEGQRLTSAIGEIWPLIYTTVVLSTSSKTVIVTITSMGVGD